MLVADIVRRVRDSAGDTAVLQFTQATLTDWINDAVRECVLENSLLQAKVTTSTVIDQADYSLPENIFKIHSVIYNGYKLEILTREQWEDRNASEPETGTDTTQTSPFQCYIYAGFLTLWPTPNAVNTLVLNYTKMPETITHSTSAGADVWAPNIPPIHEAFHSRIVHYCLAQVAMQDDDFDKYTALMEGFKSGVMDLKHIKDQEEDLYPFISVSSRDMGNDYGYAPW